MTLKNIVHQYVVYLKTTPQNPKDMVVRLDMLRKLLDEYGGSFPMSSFTLREHLRFERKYDIGSFDYKQMRIAMAYQDFRQFCSHNNLYSPEPIQKFYFGG